MRLRIPILITLLVTVGLLPQAAAATANIQPLTVIAWNVESGDADPAVIAARISAFDGVDLWGLTEVNNAVDAARYVVAASDGEDAAYAHVLGTTGGGDRLLAIYNDDRFDLLGSSELDAINVGGNVRASLVLTLSETATEQQFIFMVNHLYRTNDAGRHEQATRLNGWATRQTLPVINVGDFNFDYAVDGSSWDTGYDLMTADGVWKWVKPAQLVTTQCSGWPCRYNSVLDFVFVAGGAQTWPATSEIIVREGDFPDDSTTPDHRPVQASFTLPDATLVRIYLPAVIVPGFQPTPSRTPSPTPPATVITQPTPTPTATQPPATTTTPTVTPTPTATATQPAATAMPTPTPTATQQAGGVCLCDRDRYNCSDFRRQGDAQACFDYCVSQNRGDIHRLDGNNDGVACESLPRGFSFVR